jgi:hypothetical protein
LVLMCMTVVCVYDLSFSFFLFLYKWYPWHYSCLSPRRVCTGMWRGVQLVLMCMTVVCVDEWYPWHYSCLSPRRLCTGMWRGVQLVFMSDDFIALLIHTPHSTIGVLHVWCDIVVCCNSNIVDLRVIQAYVPKTIFFTIVFVIIIIIIFWVERRSAPRWHTVVV